MSGTARGTRLIFKFDVHHRWDLWWDPVWGGSYWTASVQYRALIMGARIAKMIGRETDDLGYRGTAKCVLEYCQESRCSNQFCRGKLNHLACRRSGTTS